MKKILTTFLAGLFIIFALVGCSNKNTADPTKTAKQAVKPPTQAAMVIEEKGSYTTREQVAAYVHKFKKLPVNYITKAEARKLGWPKKGTLDKVAPGKSIGGDHFGNYDGKLPKASGLKYTECDIDYVKGNRGAKRIVFDNKGHIYYCGDHYNTFEKLY